MLGMQLVQEQRVRLSITPEMKQSIHVLTLSSQDLARYLQDAAADNPVLEIEETTARVARLPARLNHNGGGSSYDPFLRIKGAEPTLEQLLASQIRLLALPSQRRAIAIYLAGCVSEDGYLTLDLTEMTSLLGISMDEAMAGLDVLQSLEPAGVGARSLCECLLLQMKRDPAAAPFAEQMVEAGLEALVPFHPGRVGARLAITSQQAQKAYDYISSLNPKPCRSIGSKEAPHYIIPDVAVAVRNGVTCIRLCSAGIPRVSINEEYAHWFRDPSTDESWLARTAEARAIIRSVYLRRGTLMRVVAAVLEEQERFMSEGPSGLKSLSMAVVADKIGMHESTVSRAVHGKYVQTPHGVLELKAFFTSGIATTQGDQMSASAVKLRLKALIATERTDRPFSDSTLTTLLQKEGIILSRRTVAKYREELQILSSLERKRWG